jgi:transposase InsO family protein
VKFEFIADQAGLKEFPIDYMCRMLGVTRQGYYQWKNRGPSQHERDDSALKSRIRALFEFHKKRYGVRRIHAELLRGGERVAYKRVQRLMREMGLVSVHPRPWRRTTIAAAVPSELPDLVGREFVPDAPDTLWYGDITYVRTWAGWAYIASVIDGYSRKVVGWAIADHMRTELVTAALGMAIEQRKPAGGVIFHADRGSQYTSAEFVGFCADHEVRNSVGRTGICYDNAAAESFWATLKKEFIHLHPFDTLAKLRRETFEYIEGYYNLTRIHSSLGYMTPVEYEEAYVSQNTSAA